MLMLRVPYGSFCNANLCTQEVKTAGRLFYVSKNQSKAPSVDPRSIMVMANNETSSHLCFSCVESLFCLPLHLRVLGRFDVFITHFCFKVLSALSLSLIGPLYFSLLHSHPFFFYFFFYALTSRQCATLSCSHQRSVLWLAQKELFTVGSRWPVSCPSMTRTRPSATS